MSLYRKKPVVIEALKWDGSEANLLTIKARWPNLETAAIGMHGDKVLHWSIATLEGSHRVSVGDYIVQGVKGAFYPCKEEIFHLTYEEVV